VPGQHFSPVFQEPEYQPGKEWVEGARDKPVRESFTTLEQFELCSQQRAP
jgi:hypothetical protein